MYRIRDLQFKERYFADGALFETKREACEQLIGYHSNDCDMTIETQLSNAGRIDDCWKELQFYEWALEPVECKACGSLNVEVLTLDGLPDAIECKDCRHLQNL